MLCNVMVVINKYRYGVNVNTYAEGTYTKDFHSSLGKIFAGSVMNHLGNMTCVMIHYKVNNAIPTQPWNYCFVWNLSFIVYNLLKRIPIELFIIWYYFHLHLVKYLHIRYQIFLYRLSVLCFALC